KRFEYPQQFAEDIFVRIEQALQRRVSGSEAFRTGRLVFDGADVPELPARYLTPSDERERREGKYLVSYQTSGGWLAISKSILTEVLGAGRDVRIAGLPPAALDTLKLMCP